MELSSNDKSTTKVSPSSDLRESFLHRVAQGYSMWLCSRFPFVKIANVHQ